MKEKVLIYPVTVRKKGEVKSFQIILPEDARRIIGIETTVKDLDVLITPGGFGGEPLAAPGEGFGGEGFAAFGVFAAPAAQHHFHWGQTYLAGYLKLQSCERANIFYAGDVRLTDNNLGYGNFSQTNFFRHRAWTHGYRREEDVVCVNECCSVIQGTYTDAAGLRLNVDAQYTVKVYVWYEAEEIIKQKTDDCQPCA